MNKLLPWSEKYRPIHLDSENNSVIGHDKIRQVLLEYKKHKMLPNLLFYGPPGTGKTSMITAFAREYYNEDYDEMVMILNASEERGIETVRTRIKQFSNTLGYIQNPNTPSFKLIILDEIDAMTDEAQTILKRIIEQYILNVRFCFICNYLKKINPAIQSRCILFRFKPLPTELTYEFIIGVCEKENLQITKKAVDILIKKANGDLRKILNILQSSYMHNDLEYNSENTVNENTISKLMSSPTKKNIITILQIIQTKTLDVAFTEIFNLLKTECLSLLEIINELYELCTESILGKHENHPISKYSIEQLVVIIKKINTISENLSYSNNEYIQFASFISIFYE